MQRRTRRCGPARSGRERHVVRRERHQAANLAVPLLQDENEEIRYSALAVLEKNPNESYFPDVLQMARSGGGRVMEASFPR